MMRLSKFIPSRLVFILARKPYLLEVLRLKVLLLGMTTDKRRGKEREIWEEFYRMTAMINRKWMGSN
jgi:hypothetical protein